MINWLIDASLRNRFVVVAVCLLLGAWAYWGLLTTPIDAIPDLSDNQVIVFTDWPGRSPQEIEDQVTYPLTVSLQGRPGAAQPLAKALPPRPPVWDTSSCNVYSEQVTDRPRRQHRPGGDGWSGVLGVQSRRKRRVTRR